MINSFKVVLGVFEVRLCENASLSFFFFAERWHDLHQGKVLRIPLAYARSCRKGGRKVISMVIQDNKIV